MINIIFGLILQKKIPFLQKEGNENMEVKKLKDLYSLTPEERWNTYFAAVRKIQGELMTKMNDLLVSPL